MNPFFVTDFSISDSLKTVQKSVLIYETIIEFIWKSGRPTVKEFLEYLDKPVTVGKISECFKDEFKTIPAFEGDYFIGFNDVILEKDPYRVAINEKRQVIKDKRVYPNDPCPCGSGKKYKKCCGK